MRRKRSDMSWRTYLLAVLAIGVGLNVFGLAIAVLCQAVAAW